MTVNLVDDQPRGFDQNSVVALAEMVLAEEGFASETVVDITALTEEAIAELNRVHLGRTGPTDVLSFPLELLEPGAVPAVALGGPPLHLGDLVIAPEYVAGQAERYGVAFEDELALMVVHGLLHLMGWDHRLDEEAEAMEARERALLAKVGVERR